MPGPLPLCDDIGDIPKFPFCFVANDEYPEMVCKLKDNDGTPEDLTGYTMTLHMRRRDGSVLIKTATALDLAMGIFKFSWGPGDLVAGNNQRTEIQLLDAMGKPLTSKLFLVDVRAEIA